MKVYTRVSGELVGYLFRECHIDRGFKGYCEILIKGRWVQRGAWRNEELKDKSSFKLVGNNFKLK